MKIFRLISSLVFAALVTMAPSAWAESASEPIRIYGRVTLKEKTCFICIDCGGFSSGTRTEIDCHPSLLDGVKVRISARPRMTGTSCGLAIVGKPEILPPEFMLPSYPDVAELKRTLECKAPKK